MSNRMPSLLALLGLAAAAGYQNRDSIKAMLAKAAADRDNGRSGAPIAQSSEAGASDGAVSEPSIWDTGGSSMPRLADTGFVATLQAGLTELVQRFTDNGEREVADSWVSTGQNKFVSPDQLRPVLGDDVVAELAAKTGLTEVDLLARLAQVLPETVDQLTPDGRLPASERGPDMTAPPNTSPLGLY